MSALPLLSRVPDQLDILILVAARLDRVGIPYMVTGSLAASHYATPRFTRDIDIVIELDRASATELASALDRDFYVDADRLRAAAATRGIANVIHLESVVKVDFIVRKDTRYRREEFRRRRPSTIEGTTIWFVAPEDLVLSKLAWMKESGSALQRRDLETLVMAVADLDRAYIERWSHELSVFELWSEITR